ncbi:MAG: ABC transporter ATP-binding protein, partial [Desulfosarcinaceae bacterium]
MASAGRAPSTNGWLRLDQVSYSYPVKEKSDTLDRIDLDIRAGEYLLISGASGSGKSTLARTFNGLIPHFYGGRLRGRVTVDGRATSEQSVADLFDRVGLVFQNPRAQLFNRTVTRELAFGLESLGLPPVTMKARIGAVAEELGMAHLLARDPQSLSGGEQQLAALAAVLALRPKTVVLDEPLANLDAMYAARLRTLLLHLKADGTGVVVCEHRMRPTLPDADRVILIHKGRKHAD